MLPVKQDVIDLIDPRVESFDLRQKVCDYIARQSTKYGDRGNVESKKVWLCHFLIPIDGSLGDK